VLMVRPQTAPAHISSCATSSMRSGCKHPSHSITKALRTTLIGQHSSTWRQFLLPRHTTLPQQPIKASTNSSKHFLPQTMKRTVHTCRNSPTLAQNRAQQLTQTQQLVAAYGYHAQDFNVQHNGATTGRMAASARHGLGCLGTNLCNHLSATVNKRSQLRWKCRPCKVCLSDHVCVLR
jgi:hypothetical protein